MHLKKKTPLTAIKVVTTGFHVTLHMIEKAKKGEEWLLKISGCVYL